MSQRIGRYEILRELGRGGMATVYLGLDPDLEREVAIKVLPRQFTHDPRFLERFKQEARTVAALEHYAIVPIHGFGEEDDAPYLVMRYMSGGSLQERMGGKPVSLLETSRILERLAPALDKAHSRGVIHRDLKPGNVLFDADEQPYLADFGIARMAEATHTMTVVGTPGYMSPEQVEGQQKLDWRSDIYALGVMLFEMLSGRQPYKAETPAAQMLMHIREQVPDLLAANPDLPPQAQAVIDKAMAKDREERYQTATDLAQAVQRLLDAPVVAAEAPVPPLQPTVLEGKAHMGGADEEEKEMAAVDAAAATQFDTPPEKIGQSAQLADNEAAPTPAARGGGTDEPGLRGLLPAWAWWAGAVAVVVLLVFGIRSIFGGVGEPPPDPGLGSVWRRPQDKMPMVYVPSGTFSMGSKDGNSDEEPVHEVTLDGFWIDETEVTNAQYVQCVYAGECAASSYEDDATYNGDDYPIVGVSWNNADTYCNWAGGQLPSEAQWEYAARGPDGNTYPWGEREPTCDLAQFTGCDGNTIPVGSNPDGASWAGTQDMAGNVWEWVNDWYDSEYYANSSAENPAGPESGEFKVLRGGSWRTSLFPLRDANRYPYDPDFRHGEIGFRCVLPGA